MLSILKNPTFLLFFIGNTISLIGFGFNLIGFSWLVLEETGSEILLGQIMAAATLPGLLISMFTALVSISVLLGVQDDVSRPFGDNEDIESSFNGKG